MTHTDLMQRLEEATEGSRELDMEVFWHVFPEYERGINPIWHCLHYTTSLDAALTLVPEGLCWRYDSAVGHAEIFDLRRSPIQVAESGPPDETGYNAALALCIAALRARMSA